MGRSAKIKGWMDRNMEEEKMEDRWAEDGCKYRQTARHTRGYQHIRRLSL